MQTTGAKPATDEDPGCWWVVRLPPPARQHPPGRGGGWLGVGPGDGCWPHSRHGPCGCITPTAATPGEQLVSTYPTIKIVWNPVPADFLIGPDDLTRAHVSGQPRLVLQEQPRPSPATFRVPATAPGRYLVLLYDGTEGGGHYSWDYITVRSGPRPPSSTRPTAAATEPARRAGGLNGPVLVGLAAALVALLGASVLVLARRHRTHSGRRTGRAGSGGQ